MVQGCLSGLSSGCGVPGCGSSPHAIRFDSSQASHCNIGVVGAMPGVGSAVGVFETRLWGAVSDGWVAVFVVLLGYFR